MRLKHPDILPDAMLRVLTDAASRHGYGIEDMALSWRTEGLGNPPIGRIRYSAGDTAENPEGALRDALAMNAPVSWADARAVCGWPDGFVPRQDDERRTLWAIMVMLRYEYADAMLEARKDGH